MGGVRWPSGASECRQAESSVPSLTPTPTPCLACLPSPQPTPRHQQPSPHTPSAMVSFPTLHLPAAVASASPRTLITTSVVLSSTLTALTLLSYQTLRRKTLREGLRKDVQLSLDRDAYALHPDGGFPEPDGRDAALLADGGVQELDGRDGLAGGSSLERRTGGGSKKKFSEELIREQVRFCPLLALPLCPVVQGAPLRGRAPVLHRADPILSSLCRSTPSSRHATRRPPPPRSSRATTSSSARTAWPRSASRTSSSLAAAASAAGPRSCSSGRASLPLTLPPPPNPCALVSGDPFLCHRLTSLRLLLPWADTAASRISSSLM